MVLFGSSVFAPFVLNPTEAKPITSNALKPRPILNFKFELIYIREQISCYLYILYKVTIV